MCLSVCSVWLSAGEVSGSVLRYLLTTKVRHEWGIWAKLEVGPENEKHMNTGVEETQEPITYNSSVPLQAIRLNA